MTNAKHFILSSWSLIVAQRAVPSPPASLENVTVTRKIPSRISLMTMTLHRGGVSLHRLIRQGTTAMATSLFESEPGLVFCKFITGLTRRNVFSSLAATDDFFAASPAA